MSTLKIIHHPELKADQRLLMAIDELGIVRRDQLAECLGWTENSVQTYIHRIRRKAVDEETARRFRDLKKKLNQEVNQATRMEYEDLSQEIKAKKNQWIQIIHPPRDLKTTCYKLGEQGIQAIRSFRSLRLGKIEERSDAHWAHYLGTNDILVRLIRTIKGQHTTMAPILDRIKWYNTLAATDFLFRSMELMYLEEWKKDPKKAKDERREIIHPDAMLIIDEHLIYWIEFDRDTESPRIIERKLIEYVKTLNRVDNRNPVFWVTTSKRRRDELRDIWEYIQGTFEVVEKLTGEENQVTFLPDMYFFEAGEEVEFFVSPLVFV